MNLICLVKPALMIKVLGKPRQRAQTAKRDHFRNRSCGNATCLPSCLLKEFLPAIASPRSILHHHRFPLPGISSLAHTPSNVFAILKTLPCPLGRSPAIIPLYEKRSHIYGLLPFSPEPHIIRLPALLSTEMALMEVSYDL